MIERDDEIFEFLTHAYAAARGDLWLTRACETCEYNGLDDDDDTERCTLCRRTSLSYWSWRGMSYENDVEVIR